MAAITDVEAAEIAVGVAAALAAAGPAALPTGAATAARQDTGNTSLGSIKTDLDTVVAQTVGLATAAKQAPLAATDRSTTITAGATAQNLAGGTPTNGFQVANPDASNDLWISDTATAVANGTGCIRIPPGGVYESPSYRKPVGAVSIVGAVTGQKFTASTW